MKRALLVLMPLLIAASPPRTLDLQGNGFLQGARPQLLPVQPLPPVVGVVPRQGLRFEPAPTPNRGVDAPAAPRASEEPQLSPKLYSRGRQYRGEGFSPGSTAQEEQERNALPGAGFQLHLPLIQPQQ